MADKNYALTFKMSDGTEKKVQFTSPQGDPGAPGKSAYQYAQDAGYTGTEQEFAEKLAQDSPGGGGFVVTDDGEGNVRLDLSGSVTVSDDGAGNVVIE